MAAGAADPQALIDAVNRCNGLSFIAHPFEHSGAYANESEINWESWEVSGFTGMSIWNYMSEFKSYIHNIPIAVLAAFFPQFFVRGPYDEALAKWDELLSRRRTPAIGTSDAHATTYHLGPVGRVVFPYSYLFRAVNMHLLIPEAFTGELDHDAGLVYRALAQGESFIAYDLIAPARGFRFIARASQREVGIGGELEYEQGIEMVASAPERAELRLLCGGSVIA